MWTHCSRPRARDYGNIERHPINHPFRGGLGCFRSNAAQPGATVADMSAETVSVTGWGRTAPTTSVLIRPRTYEEAVAAGAALGALTAGLGARWMGPGGVHA